MKLYVKDNCPNSFEAIHLLTSYKSKIPIIFIEENEIENFKTYSNNSPYLFKKGEYIGGLKELKKILSIEE